MWTYAAVVAGTLLGGFLGYMTGAYLDCNVFPMGNLCGLMGVFFTGPFGAVCDGTGGWYVSRRR